MSSRARRGLLLAAGGLLWFGAWHVHALRSDPWPAIRTFVAESEELRRVVGTGAHVGWLPVGRMDRGGSSARYAVAVHGPEGSVRTRFEVRSIDSRWRVVEASYGGLGEDAVALSTRDADRLRRAAGLSMRAFALAQNGLLADALTGFDSAVALDDGNPKTFHWRGWVRGELGDLDGAIEDYRRALELDDGYGDAHYGLGVAAGRAGDLQLSLRHLDRAVELKPSSGLAHFSRAVTRSRLGDEAGMQASLGRACDLDYRPACDALARAGVTP